MDRNGFTGESEEIQPVVGAMAKARLDHCDGMGLAWCVVDARGRRALAGKMDGLFGL